MPFLRATSLWTSLLLAEYSIASVILQGRATEPMNYGKCTNPTLEYIKNPKGIDGYGFKAVNTQDFPHDPTPEITTMTEYMCSTLKNACRASSTTVWLCDSATSQIREKGLKDEAAVAFFNEWITYTTPTSSSTSSATKSPTPSPSATLKPKVNIKFSSQYVEFPGHIDPVWWFNTYLNYTGEPAICDKKSARMPNKFYLSFDCEGADKTSLPLMHAALNAAVTSTLKNTSMSDDERLFRHTYKSKHVCIPQANGIPSCTNRPNDQAITIFPQSVHIVVSNDVTDFGGFLQGNLRYDISKSSDSSCSACAFFASAGGGSAAVAGIAGAVDAVVKTLSPQMALLSALVTIGCLASC